MEDAPLPDYITKSNTLKIHPSYEEKEYLSSSKKSDFFIYQEVPKSITYDAQLACSKSNN